MTDLGTFRGANNPSQVLNETRVCAVEGCHSPIEARGFCSKHYWRLLKHGNPLAGGTVRGQAMKFYLDSLAYDGNDCLIWPYAKSRGYGTVKHNGKMCEVHRLVCEKTNGPPPSPKHEAAHSCGNGHEGCITKRHLSWKTRAENIADRLIHGTHNRGERHYGAKLTEEAVREILSLKGKASLKEISSLFGISEGHVSHLHAGRTWAWLGGQVE